jgi:hypothetical protein
MHLLTCSRQSFLLSCAEVLPNIQQQFTDAIQIIFLSVMHQSSVFIAYSLPSMHETLKRTTAALADCVHTGKSSRHSLVLMVLLVPALIFVAVTRRYA